MPEDDSSNNIDLVCPTNHYSNHAYDDRKSSMILIKRDNWFEPVFSYYNNNGEQIISSTFTENDKNLKDVFTNVIRKTLGERCPAIFNNRNREYRFEQAKILDKLIPNLEHKDYIINTQVLNFQGKVIGLLVTNPDKINGFVPCYPSSLEDIKRDVDVVFMTDLTLWNTYTTTVQFLNKLSKRSGKRREGPDIPCKPVFKVIEDEHVVGILTETNQFIQLSQPIRPDEIESGLDIPSIDNDNYIVNVKSTPMVASEVEITTQTDVDTERVEYIKKIRLETSFYNVFRNTIRILVNNYENAKIRLKIEEELAKEYVIYSEKLKSIIF
jgi:hypothetical protein